MPLYSFLSILLQTFLLRMDIHKGGEAGEHIDKLQLFFFQFSGDRLIGLLQQLHLRLVGLLQLLYDRIVVAYRSGQLVLLLFHYIRMRQLLGKVLTLGGCLLPHRGQKRWEFIDNSLILCDRERRDRRGGVGDDGRFPETGGERPGGAQIRLRRAFSALFHKVVYLADMVLPQFLHTRLQVGHLLPFGPDRLLLRLQLLTLQVDGAFQGLVLF